MSTLFRIALTALVFTGLTACGAKGPLVLPEKAEPLEVTAADADPEAVPENAEEQAGKSVDTPAVVPAVKPDGNG